MQNLLIFLLGLACGASLVGWFFRASIHARLDALEAALKTPPAARPATPPQS